MNKQLIVILGPTASGKTELGVRLARQLNTEIISADSRQFYREMNIGTAKPDEKEMAGVPHHFIGNLSLDDYYNVSIFEAEVLDLLEDLFRKYNHVLMAGGSGLYIDAVCTGIDDLPDADDNIRQNLKDTLYSEGVEKLRVQLKELDPEYYAMVDLNNPNRIMRALEVCLQTGLPYSSLRKSEKKERYFDIIKIGLNLERDELFRRINMRVDNMMKRGLLEEAKELYMRKDCNALNTVGYKELFDCIEGRVNLERAVENIKTNTRRYAKRQLTWFKRDKDIRWFHPDDFRGILKYLADHGLY